jgi:hypothetical protein
MPVSCYGGLEPDMSGSECRTRPVGATLYERAEILSARPVDGRDSRITTNHFTLTLVRPGAPVSISTPGSLINS